MMSMFRVVALLLAVACTTFSVGAFAQVCESHGLRWDIGALPGKWMQSWPPQGQGEKAVQASPNRYYFPCGYARPSSNRQEILVTKVSILEYRKEYGTLESFIGGLAKNAHDAFQTRYGAAPSLVVRLEDRAQLVEGFPLPGRRVVYAALSEDRSRPVQISGWLFLRKDQVAYSVEVRRNASNNKQPPPMDAQLSAQIRSEIGAILDALEKALRPASPLAAIQPPAR